MLKDDRPTPPKRDLDDGPAATKAARRGCSSHREGWPAEAPKAAPGKAPASASRYVRGRATGKKTYAPGAATPLESTLEILGASTLTLDESREIINDSAIRAPAKKPDNSATGRFARLLGTLSGG